MSICSRWAPRCPVAGPPPCFQPPGNPPLLSSTSRSGPPSSSELPQPWPKGLPHTAIALHKAIRAAGPARLDRFAIYRSCLQDWRESRHRSEPQPAGTASQFSEFGRRRGVQSSAAPVRSIGEPRSATAIECPQPSSTLPSPGRLRPPVCSFHIPLLFIVAVFLERCSALSDSNCGRFGVQRTFRPLSFRAGAPAGAAGCAETKTLARHRHWCLQLHASKLRPEFLGRLRLNLLGPCSKRPRSVCRTLGKPNPAIA